MRDSLVALRTAVDLTATANATAVDLGKGNTIGDMVFQIYVPAIVAAADTVDFIIQQSDDNFSTTKEQTYVPQVTGAAAATSSPYFAKVKIMRRYIRLRSVVAGSAPNFGVVTCYASTGMSARAFNVKNT